MLVTCKIDQVEIVCYFEVLLRDMVKPSLYLYCGFSGVQHLSTFFQPTWLRIYFNQLTFSIIGGTPLGIECSAELSFISFYCWLITKRIFF